MTELVVRALPPMDNAQRCRDQAMECLRQVELTRSEREAEVLRNISSSWSRLAGQIDRYTALVREGRIARKAQLACEASRSAIDK
jgi:hypothetical protein